MANVERHDFFPTCLYKFKHEFEDNELKSMVTHIHNASLGEKNPGANSYMFNLLKKF